MKKTSKEVELQDTLNQWASHWKISNDSCIQLWSFIVAYEAHLVACLSDDIDDFCNNYEGIKTRISSGFLLEPWVSAEDMKTQAKALRRTLDNLSPETICILAAYLNPADEGLPKRLVSLTAELIHACELVGEITFKKGAKEPVQRLRFVMLLGIRFHAITKKKPRSTPGKCFEELVSYAYEYYETEISDIPRDIQKANLRAKSAGNE